ncbi:MAG: hypothetical protein ABIH38_01205 [Patescibacteria group bacterium]
MKAICILLVTVDACLYLAAITVLATLMPPYYVVCVVLGVGIYDFIATTRFSRRWWQMTRRILGR